MPAAPAETVSARKTLRERLLAARERFFATDEARTAEAALTRTLRDVLRQIEPELLGVYCAVRSEFDAVAALRGDAAFARLALALPFARRAPPAMEYRRWDGAPPRGVDECGIAACDGEVVTPDTVLEFTPQPHDRPLTLVVTDAGVFG
jgi:5-formyltetrahydrofolate cyclo-ligase